MLTTTRTHTLEVPTFYDGTTVAGVPETLTIFAREIIPEGGKTLPYLLYLQGGPGFGAPRPLHTDGWLGEALKNYRVILLDQRGTGNSTPISAGNLANFGPDAHAQAHYLSAHRQDSIVRDAEALRVHLAQQAGQPAQPWTLLGQSFGGFCITSYLSLAPEGIQEAFLTGGLPALDTSIDDIYRATIAQTHRRQAAFYERFPECELSIHKIIDHLGEVDELLPTGERLTPERFKTIGINLGRGVGFDSLAFLLEDPFDSSATTGSPRLKESFLAQVSDLVSFAGHPLYAVIHEAIYGGATTVLKGESTNWSAYRMWAEDTEDTGNPYNLTGEHIFPWQFKQDPALRGFAEVVEILAQKTDWPAAYNPEILEDTTAPLAAAIYLDDMFVPYKYSSDTAASITGVRPYITNEYQHSGLGDDGATIFRKLRELNRT